jgi:hypothetical protein
VRFDHPSNDVEGDEDAVVEGNEVYDTNARPDDAGVRIAEAIDMAVGAPWTRAQERLSDT